MKVTITEIRNFLKNKNANIKKEKFMLNNNTAYKVTYADGTFIIDTVRGIKDRYKHGVL